jgi:hypothetical protein
MSGYYETLTYNVSNPFAASKLKLKRAKRHLLEVERAARELPLRDHYEFILPFEPKAGKHNIWWMHSRLMPAEFAIAVGDAIHNLRSSLDFIAIALTVPPLGAGKADDTYFPTGVTRQAFIRARDGFTNPKGKWVKGKMEGAGPDALRLVEEELEPYGGGKYSIRELHELDILDKHKLIVPAISRMRIENLQVAVGNDIISLGPADFQADDNGNQFAASVNIPSDLPAGLKLGNDFKASFTIVFGKGQPLDGQPIVEALTKLANISERFIEKCEAFFPRTN